MNVENLLLYFVFQQKCLPIISFKIMRAENILLEIPVLAAVTTCVTLGD